MIDPKVRTAIEDFIDRLLSAGFTLCEVDGTKVNSTKEAFDEIVAVGLAHLYVKNPKGGQNRVVFLPSLNPDEVVTDYTFSPNHEGNENAIDSVFDAWSTAQQV